MNRRDFLKKSAIAGGTIAAVSATKPSFVADAASGVGVKTLKGKTIDDIYEIKPGTKSFPKANTIFSRARSGDPDVDKTYFMPHFPENDKPGYGHLDRALQKAAGMSWGNKFFYTYRPAASLMEDKSSYKFKSPAEASEYIKKVAMTFKASAVGISPYDERFMYDVNVEEFKELGFKPKSVIVVLIEQDLELVKLQPMPLGGSGTGLGYSNMAEVSGKVADFISKLGYSSYAGGNNWGLSVPLAINAGLVEQSRMGISIHPKLGPNFRIAKIFTELEIERDYPIDFGVYKFCKSCMKCADACAIGAITKEDISFNEDLNKSTRTDVKKWSCDAEKCFKYWGEVEAGCGRCVAACPYFKHDTWHHQFVRVTSNLPGVHSVARYMDDLFGYGKDPLAHPEMVKSYWKHAKTE